MNKKILVLLKTYILFAVVVLATAIDQYTKYFVVNTLDLNKRYSIIKGLFSFEYLENRGVAFGFLSGRLSFITVFSMIIVVLIIYLCFWLEKAIKSNPEGKKKYTLLQFICSFLISGAFGNVIDRIRHGYVVDFISFDFFEFPTFNVADIYVTLGAFALFIIIVFFIKDDELSIKQE